MLLCSVNQTVVTLEENSTGTTTEVASKTGSASQKLVACLKTLHLLAKIRPQLLVNHAITLQPYLALKCHVSIASLLLVTHFYLTYSGKNI